MDRQPVDRRIKTNQLPCCLIVSDSRIIQVQIFRSELFDSNIDRSSRKTQIKGIIVCRKMQMLQCRRIIEGFDGMTTISLCSRRMSCRTSWTSGALHHGHRRQTASEGTSGGRVEAGSCSVCLLSLFFLQSGFITRLLSDRPPPSRRVEQRNVHVCQVGHRAAHSVTV